jgi:galactosylceramidase
VDVRLNKKNTSYVSLISRATEMHRSHQMPEGYSLRYFSSGKWQLLVGDSIVSTGIVKMRNNEWSNLRLTTNIDLITAFINNVQVAIIKNKKYSHGLCGLASSYDQNSFDNFSVTK